MTDQIEKWREEFLKEAKKEFHLIKHKFFDLDEFGQFKNDATYLRFEGFLMAKRAQKPVELPKPKDGYSLAISIDRVKDLITKSGYTYTVKGE